MNKYSLSTPGNDLPSDWSDDVVSVCNLPDSPALDSFFCEAADGEKGAGLESALSRFHKRAALMLETSIYEVYARERADYSRFPPPISSASNEVRFAVGVCARHWILAGERKRAGAWFADFTRCYRGVAESVSLFENCLG